MIVGEIHVRMDFEGQQWINAADFVAYLRVLAEDEAKEAEQEEGEQRRRDRALRSFTLEQLADALDVASILGATEHGGPR